MSQKFLIISISLYLTSCAHIKPVNKEYNPHLAPEKALESAPDTQTSETNSISIAPSDNLASAPVYKKSENDFLKDRKSKKVDFWIGYFSGKNKERLERFVANGEKYKPYIEETFEKYGLPKDLYYVGLIESGYYNASRSHAGAVGPWQFMPATARRYGLRVTRKIDERQSIFKSTEAAALYFQDLYNIFGSWELALAAYNKGENGIIRRIRGANTRDYYELGRKGVIPKETQHYVPKVIAVMHVLKNYQSFGIKKKVWQDNPFADVVSMDIDRSVSVTKLANKLKISSQLVTQLNQDIKSSIIPHPGRKSFQVYLPRNSQTAMKSFKKYLSSLPSKKSKRSIRRSHSRSARNEDSAIKSIDTHKVRKNESLYSIAKRYGTDIKTIKKLNSLKRSTIYPGQKLKVKTNSKSRVLYSYTVKKGDNLFQIAKIFKTNSSKLKKLNKKRSSKILVGERLKVPAHRVRTYVVKRGDFLGKIAKNYKTSLQQIIDLNGGNKKIYPGQKIILSIDVI